MDRFRKLAFTTTFATYALIAWGGLVRATGSGDGCPDWPRCFGRWIPPLEEHAIIEYVHRALGSVVGIVVVALAVVALLRHRREPRILWPTLVAVVLVGVQGWLGGAVVRSGLDPVLVLTHLGMAMAVIGILTYLAVRSSYGGTRGRGGSFVRLVDVTAVATFGLLLVGAYVRSRGASMAFTDWPLMNGRLVPTLEGLATPMFLHRLLAAIVGVLVVYVVVRARSTFRSSPTANALAAGALVVYVAQVLVGAANVWTALQPAAVTGHVALSALIWPLLVALAVVARHDPAARAPDRATSKEEAQVPVGRTVTAYVALTKPRIIVLLLITTVPAMVLAGGRLPEPWLVVATLVGGTIAAGAANAINNYLDRDIDEMMRRTRRRPIPAHRIRPERALAFGYALSAVSFFFLAITVNVLAATLALAAIAFYVFVYTLWLKRTSVQNIVIGGAAGAVPALVGWAAVTGTVGLPALVLFAIVFVWTPPHFWALAMNHRRDYAAAGVPMLPAVRGEDETRRQILLYSLALFGTSLVLVPAAGMGPLYTATAVALGGTFVHRALRLWRGGTHGASMRLFRFSNVYLALLFTAVAADGLL